MMKIGVTDYIAPPFTYEAETLGNAYELCPVDMNADCTYEDIEGLLVWHAHIDKYALSKVPNCKIIVRYGVGYDAIDLNALHEAGVLFANNPDYGTEEVADTTCAMILNHIRRISQYNALSKAYVDNWQENTIPHIRRTNTQTLGIIGAGRIGTAVCLRMKAFGMQVVIFDPYKPSGHEKSLGCARVDTLDELLSMSDIITVHCPLSDETAGLINQPFLDRMKPGAALVNTARGGLVQNMDIIFKALHKGTLSTASFDVLPEEPPSTKGGFHRWRTIPDYLDNRLIINPHSAYYSQEAWVEMRVKAAETLKIWSETGRLRNAITA